METKRAFVRYVSHEIRTPLNAACLGLQLLEHEVKKRCADMSTKISDESSEKDSNESNSKSVQNCNKLVELITDISQACNISIEILNDLLMYEKIDGGLMVLEKQEISLGSFVEEVLKLFSVQVKSFI